MKQLIEIETGQGKEKKYLGRPSREPLDFSKNEIPQTQLILSLSLVRSFFTPRCHMRYCCPYSCRLQKHGKKDSGGRNKETLIKRRKSTNQIVESNQMEKP